MAVNQCYAFSHKNCPKDWKGARESGKNILLYKREARDVVYFQTISHVAHTAPPPIRVGCHYHLDVKNEPKNMGEENVYTQLLKSLRLWFRPTFNHNYNYYILHITTVVESLEWSHTTYDF